MKKLPILLILLLAVSCRTTHTATEQTTVATTDSTTHVTALIDSLLHIIHTKDSTAVKDSVVVKEKGDTVFVERWHTEYRERASAEEKHRVKERHDTLRLVKTVTITRRLYFTKTKEVNVLRWWQKALMWSGAVLWVVAIGFGVIKLTLYKIK